MTETVRSLVARTLWRIESGLDGPLTLSGLAASERVSPFHLSRAFALSTGTSPMAYVRARRLSEAARALRATDARIVEIALAAGYDSHEGFSRSFREQFGHAPRNVRANPDIQLSLKEAITMPSQDHPVLTPRFETRTETRLVGIARRYTMETRSAIPRQWETAKDEIGPGFFGIPTFGACFDFRDDAFTYLCGLVDDGRVDTERLDHVTLPAGEYAVFAHKGHISDIAETWTAIFETWMPEADVSPGEGPEFELYDKDFDPEKPGGVSIWIPVGRKA